MGKSQTWALPLIIRPSPWFLGPLWAPSASLRNPWLSQPLVGNELPHFKGVITATSYTSCSHPLETQAVKWRKINKRKKVYEEGWKNKGRGNSCTMIFSLLHSYTQVGVSLIIATLSPWHVVWMIPLIPTPFHYYIIFHIPLKGCTMDMSPPLEVETT